MTKPRINTYEELLTEKERLKALAKVQTEQIQADIRDIKEELRPITHLGATIGKFFSRKAGGILGQVGINLLVDGLIKRTLLSKTGWITRLVIPFFLKNVASHLADKPEKLIKKIKRLFSKNGKFTQEAGMDAV